MYVSSPKSPQELFLYNFLVNFSGSSVWKGLLFVNASALYKEAVQCNVALPSWVPTLSAKSLYNILQSGWFGVMVREPFGSRTCLGAMVREPFVCRTCLGTMVRKPFGSRTCLGAMVRKPFGSRTCLGAMVREPFGSQHNGAWTFVLWLDLSFLTWLALLVLS